MSVKDRLSKRSSELILAEIKEKGFIRVANPENIIKRVKKYTGIELVNNDFMLKFKETNKQKDLF